jgi:1-acyl-sn-glycerol-3-phosphate acyltransferase
MWVPPIRVRRVFIDPLIFLIALTVVLVSPVLFLVAALADLAIPGRWRAVRSVRLFVIFMLCEVVGLLIALVRWVASGFGVRIREPRFVRRHYRLLGWWVGVMSSEVEAALGLEIVVHASPKIEGPVLVFSRHAGPGDSVFLAARLMRDFGRRPRIVGKKELEFAPLFDVLGHRLPMRFIRPHPKRRELALEAVRDAAASLGPDDAFLLFPEGGNFTPRRRERAITRLEDQGLEARAARARALRYVLPPHPAGPIAAMTEAPGASVVFVAHTGTEDLISSSVIWRGMPFDRTVRVNYWHCAAAEVPAAEAARFAWLDEQWSRVDDWIASIVAAEANPEPA